MGNRFFCFVSAFAFLFWPLESWDLVLLLLLCGVLLPQTGFNGKRDLNTRIFMQIRGYTYSRKAADMLPWHGQLSLMGKRRFWTNGRALGFAPSFSDYRVQECLGIYISSKHRGSKCMSVHLGETRNVDTQTCFLVVPNLDLVEVNGNISTGFSQMVI